MLDIAHNASTAPANILFRIILAFHFAKGKPLKSCRARYR